jgi:hypothetical protein
MPQKITRFITANHFATNYSVFTPHLAKKEIVTVTTPSIDDCLSLLETKDVISVRSLGNGYEVKYSIIKNGFLEFLSEAEAEAFVEANYEAIRQSLLEMPINYAA